MTAALTGLMVIDFCWVGAGSFTTKMLADHGADVIKVESLAKVDGLRLSPPFAGGIAGVNRSGYFADRNTSKRSMALNLQTDAGRNLARELVRKADVVANNFSPGVMDRLGLGPHDVLELNPRAIYLSMSMYGTSGPYRHHIGYGSTIAAAAGLHGLVGKPGREPIGTGTNYPDHVPNPTHAMVALLAALRHRDRTGRGQVIDLAQVEPTAAALGAAILEATTAGTSPPLRGNSHPQYAPHGVFPCRGSDRWIAIAICTDEHWAALQRVLHWAAPAEWSQSRARKTDETAVEADLGSLTALWDVEELVGTLQAAGIPAGKVAHAGDVLNDPQLLARNHWQWLEHPEMGNTVYASAPFLMSGTPGILSRPAPCLGEQTVEVCTTVLGLDEAEIAELQASKVLY